MRVRDDDDEYQCSRKFHVLLMASMTTISKAPVVCLCASGAFFNLPMSQFASEALVLQSSEAGWQSSSDQARELPLNKSFASSDPRLSEKGPPPLDITSRSLSLDDTCLWGPEPQKSGVCDSLPGEIVPPSGRCSSQALPTFTPFRKPHGGLTPALWAVPSHPSWHHSLSGGTRAY